MASVEGLAKVQGLMDANNASIQQSVREQAAQKASQLFQAGDIRGALGTMASVDPDHVESFIKTFQANDPNTQQATQKAQMAGQIGAQTDSGINAGQLQDKALASAEKIAQMRANDQGQTQSQSRKEKDIDRNENWASQKWQQVTSSQPFQRFQEFKLRQGTLENAATNPSAFGDIGTVFAFMKTLDPASVVRESEYATAAQAGSLLTRAQNALSKAEAGKVLTPDQRQDILTLTRHLGSVYKQNYDEFLGPVQKQAKQRGVNIDLIDPYNVNVDGSPVAKNPKSGTIITPKDAFTGTDDEALEWANKNPNDPFAKQIKELLKEK